MHLIFEIGAHVRIVVTLYDLLLLLNVQYIYNFISK